MNDSRRKLLPRLSELLGLLRARWYLYVSDLCLIWGLAYVRLFIDPTPRVLLLFNWTPSLPYRVALLQRGPHDFAAWRLHRLRLCRGSVQTVYPGLQRPTVLQDRAWSAR
jgi:conjugal transfer pilin signal peptidase TrbI